MLDVGVWLLLELLELLGGEVGRYGYWWYWRRWRRGYVVVVILYYRFRYSSIRQIFRHIEKDVCNMCMSLVF